MLLGFVGLPRVTHRPTTTLSSCVCHGSWIVVGVGGGGGVNVRTQYGVDGWEAGEEGTPRADGRRIEGKQGHYLL
jgi:hypothetical protein